MKYIAIIKLITLSTIVQSQILNYTKTIDLNNDGIKEIVNLYDEYNAEFEKTEFSTIEIISQKDTFRIEDIDVFAFQDKIYLNADLNIDNRIGVLYQGDNTYLWFTGFQYGCCLNRTLVFNYNGVQLEKIFDREFEFKKIEEVDGQRYFVGKGFLSDALGNCYYDIFRFKPLEYLNINDNFILNRQLSSERALKKYKIIEKEIDPYNAEILQLKTHKEDCFLVSPEKSSELLEREFGIISIVKLDIDFFKGFTNDKLSIVRNELFAYYGYKFSTEYLFEYFKNKDWYNPTDISAESIYEELTEIEKYNIKLIKELEE